ncbi:MAG: D-alanyl-D-alanine carboxypeptidase family protein [Alphaproteobacteria bacterium]|nr:D-alanyl-D-alanine carboxypeptidase family protein [Alphaproteobacteria bacterium]
MTRKTVLNAVIAVTLAVAWSIVPGGAIPTAAAIETTAKQAIMIDAETGAVLLEKNADQPVPPSSMSKMMTVYLVFERLKEKSLSMSDTFLVSRKAWKRGGSKMFVEVGKKVSVADLLRGVIVQSGNDAAIVLAEGLAGDEKSFAAQLNDKGREMGLTNSTFKNASGWPEEGHLMSVRDIATVSLRTIRDFPEYYKIYAEKTFTFNGIRQGNRNPLLYRNVGADGLKTGHTEAAGYGLAASAERNGRRLILVVNGLPSMRARSVESHRLMAWGFREFRNFTLYREGDTVDTADVWLGSAASVPLTVDRDVTLTLPRRARRTAKVVVSYTGPIPAPIRKGTVIAHLNITAPDIKPIRIPLKAGTDVDRLGLGGRLSAALRYLLWGTLK